MTKQKPLSEYLAEYYQVGFKEGYAKAKEEQKQVVQKAQERLLRFNKVARINEEWEFILKKVFKECFGFDNHSQQKNEELSSADGNFKSLTAKDSCHNHSVQQTKKNTFKPSKMILDSGSNPPFRSNGCSNKVADTPLSSKKETYFNCNVFHEKDVAEAVERLKKFLKTLEYIYLDDDVFKEIDKIFGDLK